jgi:hypothetical protein
MRMGVALVALYLGIAYCIPEARTFESWQDVLEYDIHKSHRIYALTGRTSGLRTALIRGKHYRAVLRTCDMDLAYHSFIFFSTK